MIVITSLNNIPRYVMAGDLFRLTVRDATGCTILIEEEITVSKKIDFIASYRFALEDGTCPGFHLCGIFGNTKELPVEIQQAKRLEDLTTVQRVNFLRTVGIKL
jgi:hypothetical protein